MAVKVFLFLAKNHQICQNLMAHQHFWIYSIHTNLSFLDEVTQCRSPVRPFEPVDCDVILQLSGYF